MIQMISFPSSNDPSTADHAAMGTAYMILYALGPLWKYMKNNPWCHEKSASTTQVLSTSLKVCTVKTCRAWKICPGQSISTGTPYYTARNPSSPSPALHRFCSLSHSTPHLWSIMIRRPQLVNIVHTAHVSLLAHYASMGKARRASTTTQPCGSCTKLSTKKRKHLSHWTLPHQYGSQKSLSAMKQPPKVLFVKASCIWKTQRQLSLWSRLLQTQHVWVASVIVESPFPNHKHLGKWHLST